MKDKYSNVFNVCKKDVVSVWEVAISDREMENGHSRIVKRMEMRISKDIKGRLISLKIDSATRLDRTLFAVNVQYIENASVIIKTIGVTELWHQSTYGKSYCTY